MRRALRIVAVSAGIVSMVSAIVLGCVYLEDIAGHIKKIKAKISNRICDKKYIGEEFDHD